MPPIQRKAFASLIVAVISLSASFQVEADRLWIYKKDLETLTGKKYSFAAGFAFDYKGNNDFTVSFKCVDSRVRFEIYADTLITSKNKGFPFTYRVDKREARRISLRTFSNNDRGGYTYDNVSQIAKDILGGNEVFVRAVTWNNDYLEARISLAGSDNAIHKVFVDCYERLGAPKSE